MIAVELIFHKPIQDIIKEQQQVQKEITLKNKELRDLFSSKYSELLNCTDLLNGISDYTKEIITISNKTQQYMMQINEQQPINQIKVSANKPKSFHYFIKKIKQSFTKGNCYYAFLALKYLQEKYNLNETEKLYTQIFLEQLQTNYNFTNIIDSLLTHYDDLKQFIQQLIHYGSENCNNFELVVQYVNQINQYQNYKELIMLKYQLHTLSIDNIYELLVSQTIPNIQIDENIIAEFLQNIAKQTEQINDRMVQGLIANVIKEDQFNHQLYQQIQKQTIYISNELKEQTVQLWMNWFTQRIEASIALLIQKIQSQFNITEFNTYYQVYTEQVNKLSEQIQHLNQLPQQEYRFENCLEILQSNKEKLKQSLNIVFAAHKHDFETCFYYNLLLNYWNEQLNQAQIELFQEENENWDLKYIDQILFQIYKLQNYGIKREIISQIIKVMLSKVDIQFSIEYRNLATAIHPEKAQKFYQDLFANGKFNNKQLRRLQVNFDYSDQQFEPYYSNYTIVSQQKSAVKDQLNAWTQRAQETQPQKQEQQQSRFGLNLFWKKQ